MVWFKAGPLFEDSDKLLKMYEEKRISAKEAVAVISSGDNIVVPPGAAEPELLMESLANRKGELKDVRIHQMLPLREASYLKPGMEKHFRHVSWLTSSVVKRGVKEGRAGVMPGYLYEYPQFIRDMEVDVFMGTVSPMDEHGYFSFGVSVDYTIAAAGCAKKVILLVNPNMPRTMGYSFIHVSQADMIVEDSSPLLEVPKPTLSKNDSKIGDYVCQIVEDGSTIQLGLGSLANSVAQCLSVKKGLGIHSHFITDSIVDLVECGAITNRRKKLHLGKIICSSAVGTKRLYQFINNNPLFEFHSVSYTNDPMVIAKNNNMVAINSVEEIDLLGQCASEPIGPKLYSGTGEQVDFARGAMNADNGKSIVVLHSTLKGRTKIVPVLESGSVVSLSKNDVDYVVTEYGFARLRGKTYRQRAESLIAIAHPDHRDGLTEAAKKFGLTR
ncbi:acetyl-CoA hydrolase/transferase [Desulforamulus reducens MI-1]|uniref:Acetyl-CoA hydrolase/transferase n=1 Tax=Desulforamulus reducens (strain ATCC BAA-1160 / DSM 100696 / MI-1) TaxID=349161 RepID=A4J446_DESRM|nr:acetyl-CoA hydrolase/transferase C-terminal domain-containing protein [Desulforamulus reducens]ABO49849.1 acetyl-CoA hydrolase/transferase [Desulforamulus reducens MI-1]